MCGNVQFNGPPGKHAVNGPPGKHAVNGPPKAAAPTKKITDVRQRAIQRAAEGGGPYENHWDA